MDGGQAALARYFEQAAPADTARVREIVAAHLVQVGGSLEPGA